MTRASGGNPADSAASRGDKRARLAGDSVDAGSRTRVETGGVQARQLLNQRYRLTEVVGVGRDSVVWRAQDEELGRTVAIRTLVGVKAVDGRCRERMVAAVRAAAAVIHPNVAHTYDYGESPDGEPFAITELVPGETLAERTTHETLSPLTALQICAQVAMAVAAAHDKGVIHGNIKPSNVVLTPNGVKVVDLAMTPLSAPDSADMTAASDVCALGLLIYWLLARDLPWPSDVSAQALLAHLGSEQARLPALPDLPNEVFDVCLRCLERDPDQRPSAGEVAAVLGSVVERPPLALSETASWLADESAVPVRTVRLSRMAQLAGAMALVVAGVLWLMSSVNSGPGNAVDALIAPIGIQASTTRPSAPSTTTVTPSSESATPSPTPSPSETPTPSPSPVPTPPVIVLPAPPIGQSLSGTGGTIFVICQNREARVTSLQPNRGFTVVVQSLGPSRDIQVVFASLVHRTDIRARCGQGGLEPSIRESN